jgi:hypothetical protein
MRQLVERLTLCAVTPQRHPATPYAVHVRQYVAGAAVFHAAAWRVARGVTRGDAACHMPPASHAFVTQNSPARWRTRALSCQGEHSTDQR